MHDQSVLLQYSEIYVLHLFEAYNHASVKIPPKAPPVYKPSAPAITAPPAYKPQQANNRGVQLKPANHFRMETRPAPPVYQSREEVTGNRGQEKLLVYRPNQVNAPSAQLKPANNFRVETRPAPPVYRPRVTTTAQQHPNGMREPQKVKHEPVASPMPGSVLQRAKKCLELLSCCIKPQPEEDSNKLVSSSESESEKPEESVKPITKGKHFVLSQDMGVIAQAGDKVSNVGISGCGLVLGFGSKGIAAFHWPGMASGHLGTFMGYTSKVGELERIEIYTSPIPEQSTDSYKKTAREIYDAYEVTTVHYEYGTDVRGEELDVILKVDGAEVSGKAKKVFLSLP